MATMMKEKRKEKKKIKEKSPREPSPVAIQPLAFEELTNLEEPSTSIASQQISEDPTTSTTNEIKENEVLPINIQTSEENIREIPIQELKPLTKESNVIETTTSSLKNIEQTSEKKIKENKQLNLNKESTPNFKIKGSYKELSDKLDRLQVPMEITRNISEQRELEMSLPNAYLHDESQSSFEAISPSAPIFDEIPENISYEDEMPIESKPRVKCMAIEEVMNLWGGKEMEEVRGMSEREEELAEAGPMSGPEHPLVDLLSTFRSSLIAVERERIQFACGFSDEEKSRSTLWKIEKRKLNISEKCPCGSMAQFTATYEHAELLKERLPIAKMRLEGLLRDVQDSYCHHQHAALLAHCQIEELISHTIQSNKDVIREALALILQALRLSASAPAALARALERWAAALSAALLHARDARQLLYLVHLLFRQSRSVQWAARVLRLSVDATSPAHVLALLELLLARPTLETAHEFTEENDEWEELDKHGGSGAVSDGTLRERDLLALYRAFPLRDLMARLLLFTHSDIRQARPQEWGDTTGGRSVLRACYGVRSLLHVLRRATNAHASYVRLRQALRDLAVQALKGLACLHLVSKSQYAPELEDKVYSELEASFSSGFLLMDGKELNLLPSSLLSDNVASDYCVANIVGLHEKTTKKLDSLSVEMPVVGCSVRVRIVTQTAIDRSHHHELARMVLDFLLQTGLKRKSAGCKEGCEVAARECAPLLLAAHPYLHNIALHMVADLNIVETLDVSSVMATLAVSKWRPSRDEVCSLLADWQRRCPALLQQLLLHMDYTPHSGLSLDSQLAIANWLCTQSKVTVASWAWRVLRSLRLHRSNWRLPLEAPPPESETEDLFGTAYALLATSWGHSIPVICSEGVTGLLRLASSRPKETVHCLAGVMLVMAHSPESVALTPKFSEVFTVLLNSGPTLMQRALGRGPASGSELLLTLVLTQLDAHYEGPITRASVLNVWLHALWRAGAGSGAAAVADAAACHTRLWAHIDAYAASLLMDENSKEHINQSIREATTAPLLCECILRACHTHREARSHTYARLLTALYRQHANKHKIHVDNALQQLGANMCSDELVVYRAANAVLVAPAHHPAHLTLWRLLMHVYLQRHPDNTLEPTPPIGPLFFSGLIKSRTLNQLKRKLQETIIYHRNEIDKLKSTTQPTEQSIKTTEKQESSQIDDGLLPSLSIIDLTGESSESDSDSESESEKADVGESKSNSVADSKDVMSMIAYHTAAEKMLNEYFNWLEEGENARAYPHHADIARYIPEHALEAAWRNALPRPPRAVPLPSPPPPAPRNTSPPRTDFRIAVDTILSIKDRSKRYKRPSIKSPLDNISIKDARNLLSVVDEHLSDIAKLADEWCTEASRVSRLDAQLWELVCALRVKRRLPSVRRQCTRACAPITLHIAEHEWCISVDAERGVTENRHSARLALRRLARPRPRAVRSAAVLYAVARQIRSTEAAVRVVDRAWKCARAANCEKCAPAHTVLMTLVQQIAERWISHEGRTVSSLLSSWGRSPTSLQQSLCGALLAPRQLAHGDWPMVYGALLGSKLPPHAVFSYLSKFEVSRWSDKAESSQRRTMLDALHAAVVACGHSPGTEHHMLLEILGVHTAVLLDRGEICAHVVRCAKAAMAGTLPPSHWQHIVRAVETSAPGVSLDQLCHLLRELGVIWWEARTANRSVSQCGAHAPYIATLLRALQRCVVAAAVALSYAPERVAWYSWSCLHEAWSAWVCAHSAPALLSCTEENEHYTPMLRRFVDTIHQIMLDCPGTEITLLQQIFEWSVQSYLSVQTIPSDSAAVALSQESRVQASAMLAELAKLPWGEHQWFYGQCLQVALRVSTTTDRELISWCCATWSNITCDTLIKSAGAGEEQLSPLLASLLYLFTGTTLPHSQQILEQVCQLPWQRLPELALNEALDRFFIVHHNPALPYHDLLQFRIILSASGLDASRRARMRDKRALCVSRWLRAASEPALGAHARAHAACALRTVAELVPHLDLDSKDEIEELLSRAVVIMCIEPAASAALPVWLSWVSTATPRLVLACLSAVSTLTVFEHFATLADATVRALLNCNAPHGWHDVISRWSECPWREASPLAQRARLHAAYGCVVTHAHDLAATRDTLAGLITASVNFVELEPMIAGWICVACRVGLGCRDEQTRESAASARALLWRWAEAPRRSILQVVTMATGADRPTSIHCLLCRYAQCILEPSEDNRRSFDTACTSTLGANNDVTSWSHSPHIHKLVKLAIRLLPKYHKYFQYELSLAPETI